MTEQGLAPKEEARADTQKMDKEKLKELLVKFSEKEKYLKQMYDSADTPEKREKVKQDLDKFQYKYQEFLTQNGITLKTKPTREQLEQKLQSVQETRLKLKQMVAEEKDQEKAKELKWEKAEN